MTIDRKAFRTLSYGLYLITSRDGERLNGQVANVAVQVTSKPSRIAIALNKENLTHQFVEKSGVFAVSVLAESAPMQFIGLFGFRSGRDVEKLAQVNYETGKTGAPMVTDHSVAVMEARVIQSLDVGTHTLFVGEVAGARMLNSEAPLTYAHYHEVKGGKSPKTAPTYVDEKAENSEEGRKDEMKRYVCEVCGYVYVPTKGDPDSGVAPGTAFEDLPGDWVCPVCGAGKDQFKAED